MTRRRKLILFIPVLILLLLLVGFFVARIDTPRLDRAWAVDQAIPATVAIEDDVVRIQNVRNYQYRSTTDYTPQYYDTTVLLSELERVDFIVEPFGEIGAAHTFLSFGFADGQHIAVSVEIRKEVGETFSPVKGVLNQYELMYVIADERDVIDLRANHRKHDVYLYPTTASPEAARQLFVDMLNRADSLMTTPEFYNTVTNNCTTNIAGHINTVTGEKTVSFDHRLILPAYSDALAQSLGFVAQEMTLEEARTRYRINERAAGHAGSPDFSRLIREGRDSVTATTEKATVVAVLDGDTIEVETGGGRDRVRYIGVDTPEMNYTAPPAECLAEAAKRENEALVLGQRVDLETDTSERDAYGRLLRYVSVDGEDVAAKLLALGYAKTVTIDPDTSRADVYKTIENEARLDGLGLWRTTCRE